MTAPLFDQVRRIKQRRPPFESPNAHQGIKGNVVLAPPGRLAGGERIGSTSGTTANSSPPRRPTAGLDPAQRMLHTPVALDDGQAVAVAASVGARRSPHPRHLPAVPCCSTPPMPPSTTASTAAKPSSRAPGTPPCCPSAAADSAARAPPCGAGPPDSGPVTHFPSTTPSVSAPGMPSGGPLATRPDAGAPCSSRFCRRVRSGTHRQPRWPGARAPARPAGGRGRHCLAAWR